MTAGGVVSASRLGRLLAVQLCRPKAMNSVNFEVLAAMESTVFDRLPSPDVGALLLKGVEKKAFSAGGDLKTIYNLFQQAHNPPASANAVPAGKEAGAGGTAQRRHYGDLMRGAYTMAYKLGQVPTPQVCFWDGVVMGVGVGMTMYAKHKVATEHTILAMPEVKVGLFPDAGASYWMNRLQDGYGAFIGLCGHRLKAADLLHTGMASHFVSSDHLPAVEKAISGLSLADPDSSEREIRAVLDDFQHRSKGSRTSFADNSVLARHHASIEQCFAQQPSNVEEIVERLGELAGRGDAWAAQQRQILEHMSPMSLKLTLAMLKRTKHMDLKECLQLEYRLAVRCLRSHDFREGVRALLVDKDNNPQWQHRRLQDVNEAEMEKVYFASLGRHELAL